MSENNNNIVDGDVEVLDLAELEQATGGAARSIASYQKLDATLIQKLTGAVKVVAPRLTPGRILMANDGWQGPVSLQPSILFQRS